MRRVSTGGLDEVYLVESNPGVVLATHPMLKPRMDCSGPMTNTVGGRPTERRGLSGRAIRGKPVRSGGYSRDVPLPSNIDPGTVLALYPELKKSVDEIVRTNDVGGRPDERLGSYGSFTRGVSTWAGGEPRDVPKKEKYSAGVVLAQFPSLEKVADTELDQAPPSEGAVLAVFPELTQKAAEVEQRPQLPVHVKDKSFNAKTTKVSFKPWLVPDWKPKLGLRPIPSTFRPRDDVRFESAAAPSA